MRADSRCLFQKVFSVRPAARCTPRGGNGVRIAGSTRVRPSATPRAGASWKRSSLSFSSERGPGGRTSVAPARRSALPESAGADSRRAVRNPSGLNSVARAPSSNRSNRYKKGNSARAGGDAVDVAERGHLRDQAKPSARRSRSRTRRGHRGRHSSNALPVPKLRRRAAVRVLKAVAPANADSAAAAAGAAGAVGARRRQNHQRNDAMTAALRGGASPIPSRSRSRRD